MPLAFYFLMQSVFHPPHTVAYSIEKVNNPVHKVFYSVPGFVYGKRNFNYCKHDFIKFLNKEDKNASHFVSLAGKVNEFLYKPL